MEKPYLDSLVQTFFEREALMDLHFTEKIPTNFDFKKCSSEDPGGTGNYPRSPSNKKSL